MTPELWWMTWSALLAAALWIPYIVGVNTEPETEGGGEDPFTRPGDLRRLRPWVHRAHRAHLNMIEQFLPMAALVLIAHMAGVTSAITVWACAAFFVLRLVHAVGMISGRARFPARPMIFLAGFVCILVMGVEILRLG